MRYSETEPFKTHAKRVMGLHYESKSGYLYSIGEDGHFKVTEFNSRNVIHDIIPSKTGLKQMIYDSNRAVFIIGDGEGYIYVYSCLSVINLAFPNIQILCI